MDNDNLDSLASSSYCHLMESEEDFPFGAKTTSFLPPATLTNAAASTATAIATFDLPEWMEDRELLELPVGFFESVLLRPHASTPLGGSLLKMENDEDDYCSTIKPEDMLVPLAEMQPPYTPSIPPLAPTPPASPVHFSASPLQVPAPASVTQAKPPVPKIILCRKVGTSTLKNKPVQVHYQVMPVRQIPRATSATPVMVQTSPQAPSATSGNGQGSHIAAMPTGVCQVEPQVTVMSLEVPQGVVNAEVPQPCDAEELIDEMVQMLSSGTVNLDNSDLDSSEMEVNMEELLSQLEASDTNVDSDTHSLSSSASFSTSLLSESPCSAAFSPHPSETSSSAPFSPCSHSESKFPASPASLPSPVPSLGSLSPAGSTSDSFLCVEANYTGDCLEEEWSPLEGTHSYSRLQRKARPSRRTPAARKTPYPEDRKERKKEQNKQAALRYRQKKKQEEDDLMSKIQAEEDRQERLKSTYTSLKQELSCLKKIMREVFVARGILSEEALKKAALAKKNASKKHHLHQHAKIM